MFNAFSYLAYYDVCLSYQIIMIN